MEVLKMELEDQMEAPARVVWDFLEIAYRKGLIDDFLEMASNAMDQDADALEQLGNLEDAMCQMDLEAFEVRSEEVLLPVLAALSKEKVMERLKTIMSFSRPFIEDRVRHAEKSTISNIIEVLKITAQSILPLKTVIVAIAPAIFIVTVKKLRKSLMMSKEGNNYGNL